ncbi:MAG TPA: hypothetical protein VGK40_09490 [Verrucomicrobiae bacterium]|jgi:hypothetical protein
MKPLISILIIIGLVWVGVKIFNYWEDVGAEKAAQQKAATAGPALAGLPQKLEASLQQAQQAGARDLKKWLDAHRQEVQDPRLASIELDYVVLVARENPAEAKLVFAAVKERIGFDSPVYQRVKDLEKTYQ